AGLRHHLQDLAGRLRLELDRGDRLDRPGRLDGDHQVAAFHRRAVIQRLGVVAGGLASGERERGESQEGYEARHARCLHWDLSWAVSARIRPSMNWITRAACAAISASWVTRMMVLP